MRWFFIVWFAVAVSWAAVVQASSASPEERCRQTREAHAQLAAHVANFENIQTTRTPEGGPYRAWTCKGEVCVQHERVPILRYEPDHPDADENGMVAYPNLNRDEEYQGILAGYAELSILAKLGACGAIYVDDKEIKGILYDDSRIGFDWIAFFMKDGLVRYVFTESRKTN